MISVGIIGASGYTGEELVRILQNHPGVEIKSLTSRSHAGKKISDIFDLVKPLKGTREIVLNRYQRLSSICRQES